MCGVDGMDVKLSNNKLCTLCTSCAQKVVICKEDGSQTSSNNNDIDNTDVLSAGLDTMKLSNDDDGVDILDNKLFQDSPPKEDCPICMLPMPFTEGVCGVGTVYMPCCGKLLCFGCVFAAQVEMKKGNMKSLCAFCRVPLPDSNKEYMKRFKKRMDLNDAEAFYELACQYEQEGVLGLTQDFNKALELMNRAAELGSLKAHHSIAQNYYNSDIVEKDLNKAIYHWQIAATGGHMAARYNLAVNEYNSGNMVKAMKHFMIAARDGCDVALKRVGKGYKEGHVTKNEYASMLRAYQSSCDEMKSGQRTKAALHSESW